MPTGVYSRKHMRGAKCANYRHGEYRRIGTRKYTVSSEYMAWRSMKYRCDTPTAQNYYLYGGRGITYAARWKKFENFLVDMGRKPSPLHTLDRTNTNGNYTKANCRWAPPTVQMRNRRHIKMTEALAAKIRAAYAKGKRIFEIADQFKIPRIQVHRIVHNKTWK